jgi:hypothetical protein
MHQMVTYHFLCLRTPQPHTNVGWFIGVMVVGCWSLDSSVVGVSVVTGCHRLSPVVTGCGLPMVGCRLLLIIGPLVDSGNSDNGDRPRRCW